MASNMCSVRPINVSTRRKRVSLMPRSSVPQVLLHDNSSQQCLLNITLDQLTEQHVRMQRTLELRRRSFLTEQALKQEQLSERGVHHVAILPAGVANAYGKLTRFYKHRVKSLPPAIHVHEDFGEENENAETVRRKHLALAQNKMSGVRAPKVGDRLPVIAENATSDSARHRLPDIHKKVGHSSSGQLLQKSHTLYAGRSVTRFKLLEDEESYAIRGIGLSDDTETPQLRTQTSHSSQWAGQRVNAQLQQSLHRGHPPPNQTASQSTHLLLHDPRFIALQRQLTSPDPNKYIDGFLTLSEAGMSVIQENLHHINAWQLEQNPVVDPVFIERTQPKRKQSSFRPDIAESVTSLHFSTDSELSDDDVEN